jgi:hypothetical protein
VQALERFAGSPEFELGLRDLLYRPEGDGLKFSGDLLYRPERDGPEFSGDLLYRPERDVIRYEALQQAPRMPGLA